MDEADALEALSNVLNRLTENPYDIALHAENVRLAYSTGMEDQIDSALDMVTAFWMAGDEVWMPIIDRKQSTSNLESAQDLKAILNLYERAEQDYLCACCSLRQESPLSFIQLFRFCRDIWSSSSTVTSILHRPNQEIWI